MSDQTHCYSTGLQKVDYFDSPANRAQLGQSGRGRVYAGINPKKKISRSASAVFHLHFLEDTKAFQNLKLIRANPLDKNQKADLVEKILFSNHGFDASEIDDDIKLYIGKKSLYNTHYLNLSFSKVSGRLLSWIAINTENLSIVSLNSCFRITSSSIAILIIQNKKIEELYLADCDLNHLVIAAISSLKFIKNISLSRGDIAEYELLAYKVSEGLELDMSNSTESIYHNDPLNKESLYQISYLSTIEVLDLSGRRFVDFKLLESILKSNPHIKELSARACPLSDQDIESLSTNFQNVTLNI